MLTIKMKKMQRKFKTGDKVILKSDTKSNQPMTVNGYQIDEPQYAINGFILEHDCPTLCDRVQCVWRDNEDKPHKEYYNENALTAVGE